MSDSSLPLSSRAGPLNLALPSAAALPASPSDAIAGAPTDVRIDLHDQFAEVETDWRSFEVTAERTVFQSFDWLAKWQQHIGARRNAMPALVTGRDVDGRLLLIMPLVVERGRFFRRLTWLGSDQCDYNAPLIAPDYARSLDRGTFAGLWRSVIARLRADPRFRFDFIDLQKMPETLAGRPNPFLQLPVSDNPSGAHAATLDGDWATFYATRRSAKRRRVARADQRHLAERGEVSFVDATDQAARATTFDTLVAQKRRSLATIGADDIFAPPGTLEFYRDVATDPALVPFVHVCRLDVGAATGATTLALTKGDCYCLVLSSYHDGLASLGPGRALLHSLLRATMERGFARFDFTIGDEAYKREWCDIEMALYDYSAAVTLKAWPVAGSFALARRVKRFVKQTPPVFRAYIGARTAIATLLARATGSRPPI